MYQTTIKKAVELVGIGLHKGFPVRLRLEPLELNAGIIFYRSDVDVAIPLIPANVVDTKIATVIGKDGYVISTIEHMLSAVKEPLYSFEKMAKFLIPTFYVKSIFTNINKENKILLINLI